ncbi:hypothetical protein WMY93_030880 [Mugilogobius chulae]|uniref:Farnesyl diphosphate synthase n=1 Tax=Mugilogobius chulae TaxID=88201 RepID=A0AAW0MKY6_9GOBI
MPSPSESSSVASGSRGWSDSRRGMSARGSARLLLYLGLCHLGLGAMVLAFSFTSMAFTSSARVRQSCPFWAGFFVVASGIVGVISWRRPLTLVVSLFMLLSAVCVILSLAGSMLSCQNAQMVKNMLTCQVENGLCVCCAPTHSCSITEEETLVLYLNADCHSVRHQLKDLLFSACGLSILSTVICTLSTVTCSIHIFSLDLVHLLAPHRTRSVNPECTTPQDAFLTNIMDFEEFVPPIPPPPYYPPEYTCSSETDAQSITYNGSMESPVPLYPTDCPPPYEAVMGQRAASQGTMFDANGAEVSGERATSTAFSGEVSMDSGSLLMSEIVDIPDDSSPSEDSCLMEVGLRTQGERGVRSTSEGTRGRAAPTSASEDLHPKRPRVRWQEDPESPVLRRQALLTSSCSQLEAMTTSNGPQTSNVPEIQVRPSTPSAAGQNTSTSDSKQIHLSQGAALHNQPLYLRRRAGKADGDGGRRRENEGFLGLVRSHSEPGIASSTDTVDFESGSSKEAFHTSTDTAPGSEACLLPRTSLPPTAALPRKGSVKAVSTGGNVPAKPSPTSPRRLPKDCHRSLGDLKVTRVLMARFLQRSKRNLAPSSEHTVNNTQGPKRREGLKEPTRTTALQSRCPEPPGATLDLISVRVITADTITPTATVDITAPTAATPRGNPPAQLWRPKLLLLRIVTATSDSPWVVWSSVLGVCPVKVKEGQRQDFRAMEGHTTDASWSFCKADSLMKRCSSSDHVTCFIITESLMFFHSPSLDKVEYACYNDMGDKLCNGVHGKKALLSLSDSQLFEVQFEELVTELTEKDFTDPALKDALQRLREVLVYNAPGGKRNRGLSVIGSLRELVPPPELTQDLVQRALLVGWCIELLQAFFLVADDIMDGSVTRRGQPCWYKKDGIDQPYYVNLLELFTETSFQTELGQTLDLITAPPGHIDLNRFTIQRYRAIVKYKTAFYSFYLPVASAMYMAGITSEEEHNNAKHILLEMGEFFQIQDDYLDCYGDPAVTGKIGTDIQDNKCSWLVVTALEVMTPEQRAELEACYGRHDEASVEKVKTLYNTLQMPELYRKYEDESYQRLQKLIARHAENLPHAVFLNFAKKIYKRNK